ncbi:hypothetical protein D3C84_822050 [compost metagenome]
MGQVTTVGQAHAQDGVASRQQGQVNGAVGLRAGVRLNVGVVGAEQLFCSINCKLLDDVDVLATAVVALARVAFGVLVGQYRALSFHHRWAGVVFRSDQLDVFFLALSFLLHGGKKVGVVLGNGQITAEHGGPQGSGGRKGGHSNPMGFVWHMKRHHVADEWGSSSCKPQVSSGKLKADWLLLVA